MKGGHGASAPLPTLRNRRRNDSIRAKHELAVAFEVGAGAHVELAVLADEEQRALRHLLGALQQLAGIVGAHLVGERLAVLVIGVAGVGLALCAKASVAPPSAVASTSIEIESLVIACLHRVSFEQIANAVAPSM